jgi:hypothetical protein
MVPGKEGRALRVAAGMMENVRIPEWLRCLVVYQMRSENSTPIWLAARTAALDVAPE